MTPRQVHVAFPAKMRMVQPEFAQKLGWAAKLPGLLSTSETRSLEEERSDDERRVEVFMTRIYRTKLTLPERESFSPPQA